MIKEDDLKSHNLKYLTLLGDIYLPVDIMMKGTSLYNKNQISYNNFIIDNCIKELKNSNLTLIATISITRKNIENQEVLLIVPFTLGFSKITLIEESYNKLLRLIEDNEVKGIINLQAITPNINVVFNNIKNLTIEQFEQIIDDTSKLSLLVMSINGVDYGIIGASENGKPLSINDSKISDLEHNEHYIILYNHVEIDNNEFSNFATNFDKHRNIEVESTCYFKLIYFNICLYIVPKKSITNKSTKKYIELVNKFKSYNN